MASNKVLDIVLATLLGAIIGAIIAGLFSLITTAMQINANSNSSETNHSSIYNSEPDSSHLDTSTSENSTNDSTPYTAETNDSNIVETIDEKESSNCGFIDNPIHKNVTEEKTNEEPTNDSDPNGEIGIPIRESTSSNIITPNNEITNEDSSNNGSTDDDNNDNIGIPINEYTNNTVFTHEFGKIELFDDRSGIAYIYKDFMDTYPIGATVGDKLTISGWNICLYKDYNSFELYAFSKMSNIPPIDCTAQYSQNEDYQFSYVDHPVYFYDNEGNLQIEFCYSGLPFDLRESDFIKVDYSLR